MEKFLQELKRRKVYNVGTFYVLASWVILQVADTLFPAFDIPDTSLRLLVLTLAAGFPLCLVITWAFDWTPQGLMITPDASPNDNIKLRTRDYLTIALLLILMGIVAVQQYVIFTGSQQGSASAIDNMVNSAAADEGLISPQLESALPIVNMSLAVLPLDNLSPDPDNAFFAAGIHEEILNHIIKIGDIRVISRTTMMRYQNSDLSLSDIARELNVGAVMEGSVRFADNRVRITTQLIRARDDAHLWSESYEFELDDIFAIQSDVALNVADAMQATLLPAEIAKIERQPTESTDAYTLYLQYRYQLEQENAGSTLAEDGWIEMGLARLKQAVELDPQFAEGYAELGFVSWIKGQISPLEELNALYDQAVINAQKEIELNPELATPYEILGRVAFDRFQWDDWEYNARRATQLNDIDGRAAVSFAMTLTNVGRYEEAWEHYTVAMSKSPYQAYYREAAIASRIWGGDYQTAFDMTDQYLAVGGDRNAYHAFRAYALNRLGRMEESMAEYEQITSSQMAASMWVVPGYYDYLRCQQGASAEVLSELELLPAAARELRLQHCAAGMNDTEMIYASILSSIEVGFPVYMTDVISEAIKGDPRWNTVQEHMGLAL